MEIPPQLLTPTPEAPSIRFNGSRGGPSSGPKSRERAILRIEARTRGQRFILRPAHAPRVEFFVHKPDEIAAKLFGMPYEALNERAKKVVDHIAGRKPIARNLAEDPGVKGSPGQRAADAVASFGGSWTFVGIFAAAMLLWVGLNAFLLMNHGRTFDPYPFILLNLFLSMLAAIQAPVILMSQNRQSEKDRLNAEHDYEVNLKAELEILLLHDKLDLLREKQWEELLEIQKEQLKILAALIEKKPPPTLSGGAQSQ